MKRRLFKALRMACSVQLSEGQYRVSSPSNTTPRRQSLNWDGQSQKRRVGFVIDNLLQLSIKERTCKNRCHLMASNSSTPVFDASLF